MTSNPAAGDRYSVEGAKDWTGTRHVAWVIRDNEADSIITQEEAVERLNNRIDPEQVRAALQQYRIDLFDLKEAGELEDYDASVELAEDALGQLPGAEREERADG